MEYLIGAVLAAVVFAFARLIGFDRDRVFYPTLLIVIATYYILFAVIGTSVHALLIESLVASFVSGYCGGGVQEESLARCRSSGWTRYFRLFSSSVH